MVHCLQLPATLMSEFHVQTLIIHKLGFNQNFFTFTLILLIKIFLCSKFPGTKFIDLKCFELKLHSIGGQLPSEKGTSQKGLKTSA